MQPRNKYGFDVKDFAEKHNIPLSTVGHHLLKGYCDVKSRNGLRPKPRTK